MTGIVLTKADRDKLLRRKKGLPYSRAEVEALCATIDALESALRSARSLVSDAAADHL